jgi:dienelactone hydrolase
MRYAYPITALLLALDVTFCAAENFAAQREQVVALGKLMAPPAMHAAEGFGSEGRLKAIYFDALPWKGKPTRVFAWLGLPEEQKGRVPGMVLVHGGGGTAFKEWVKKWNEHGFAAISIAVEGQTDQPDTAAPPKGRGWKRHDWAGPARVGIYEDSAEPLGEQWIYHAAADTVLANSLLRSLPEVNADKVGLMGISWGGVIASTVVGIDARFAFAIPTYGCGHLFDADNQWGRALRSNAAYREVWDPVLRMDRVKLPVLWLSWPEDSHFPLDCQAATYRAGAGPRMVSLIPGMKHSHEAVWHPPDSYAFAESVVRDGKPWCMQTSVNVTDGLARVTFAATKALDRAVLVTTCDTGFTGNRKWVESAATLEKLGEEWRVTAALPPGTTAWFANARSGGLTASSEYQETKSAAASPSRGAAVNPAFPGFTWDRVPIYVHFGQRSGDLTDAQIAFLASHSRLIALEKSHGVGVHGSTEKGIADTARRLKRCNPDVKVLFYFNAFINWPGYDAFKTYRSEWTLRGLDGQVVTHTSGTPRPDPSNAEFREWWSEVVAAAHRAAPLDGVFVDALPQALSPGLARQVGDNKAKAVVAGLREMIVLTKRKLGPGRLIVANGLRTTSFREILDWEGIDLVMIEHFGGFATATPADITADLESIALAALKGRGVVMKGWPGFNWLEGEMMKRPYDELLELARKRISFPLAAFLVGAQPGSYFCYSWGYTERMGGIESYPEFERRLGPPKGEAAWNGFAATREFAHASVWVDLAAKQARIDWH